MNRRAAQIELRQLYAPIPAATPSPPPAGRRVREGGESFPHPDDPLALWRQRASDVRGHALPCGQFMPEELPAEITRELADFFGD